MRDKYLSKFLLWKQKGYEIPCEIRLGAKKEWEFIGGLLKDEEEKDKCRPPKNQIDIYSYWEEDNESKK